MAKELKFHANFARAMVIKNGTIPLSLNAGVEVILKRPAKLDRASELAWNDLTQSSASAVTVELVTGDVRG